MQNKQDIFLTPNVRVIGAMSPNRVVSETDLLDVFSIDAKEWRTVYFKPNKWDGFYKSDNGEPTIVELYQAKATLVRSTIIDLEYIVKPVNINISKLSKVKQTTSKLSRTISVTDAQIGFRRDLRTGQLEPFHDRKALSVTLQIIQDTQPDNIVILGDFLDFTEYTDKFSKEPEFAATTQPALEEAAWWLAQFRLASPNSNIYYIEGNHDARLSTFIQNNFVIGARLSQVGQGVSAPPLLSVPMLLDLDKIAVQYINQYPIGEVCIDNTHYIHGNIARGKSQATAKKYAEHMQANTIFGHIHKIETASGTLANKTSYHAYCHGCLCRTDYVVPGHKPPQEWQQGIGETITSENLTQIYTHSISDGECLYNGKIYRHKTIIDQLCADTGWKF